MTMEEKDVRKIVVFLAFCLVMAQPLLAGLVDHGDDFGFPNVNVDAHLKIIARHHFPDVMPEPAERPCNEWRVTWEKDIQEAATGLDIPANKLKQFIEYVIVPEDYDDDIPAPHEKLKEFELYAHGRKSLFIEGKFWKEYPPAWKKILELPLEQRRFTTIPVLYYFHRYTFFRATAYINDILPQITAARKQGCRDTYGCEYALCSLSSDLMAYDESNWEVKLDEYHTMIRDYALRWKVGKTFRHTNWDDSWCYAAFRGDGFYSGEEMPGLRFNLYMETEENLRELCRRSDAMRDFIVAIGLTNRDMKTVRKVALSFAESSSLNTPVLALRLPFEEAEQLLSGKPEYAQLLALLRIKQLSGMEKVKAIDAYLAKFPDYTPDDMPVTSLALNTHRELNAMAGFALLKMGQPVAALERWIKGGTPEDIGLIAEQIFTTDELLAFCQQHLPPSDGIEYDIESDQCALNSKRQYPFFINAAECTYVLHNLLARRLMRDKRQAEARKWFTGGETRFVSELFFHLTELKSNPQSTAENRLAAQLTLATLILRKGDILFGTLLEPDNLICHGQYSCIWGGSLITLKLKHFNDETNPDPNVIDLNIKKPDLPRFHYRWIAAEQFREAAKMTDDPRIKGFCFWKAGTILKYRDLALANDDFRALYAIMPELTEKNWFKPVEDVSTDVKAMDLRLSFFKSPDILLSWKCPMPVAPNIPLPENDGTPEALIKLGIKFMGEYSLKNIYSAFRAFHLAGDKGLAEGYVKCAEYFLDHKKSYGMAIAYLKKAIEMNQDSNLTRLKLAHILLKCEWWAEGISLVQYVADHEKNDKELLSMAADIMYQVYSQGVYGLAPDPVKQEIYRKKILPKEKDDEE